MKRLKPHKLHVTYMEGVSYKEPIIPRCYTLAYSDITGNLFLNIGLDYHYSNGDTLRDEVSANWDIADGKYLLKLHCHVEGENNINEARRRYFIFKKELPLAIEALRYGDKAFYQAHTRLDAAQIYVYFNSIYSYYNKIENFGTPSDYR
ncbi:staygreen family protein [Clostridium sp. DJ247]|uniref:staygreen family protein n=1 Tax=Clostridium sp. DJ247 TaxID=2726188 RepID=UPI0016268E4B|nr:staygreen family protein [Clostridium sp. DJ247]MBC2581654.1 hypothetical protein [Clostridium sp. DJ247]